MKVLILGCGWTGVDYAGQVFEEGAEVWCTSTNEGKLSQFRDMGWHALHADFDKELPHSADLPAFDYVLTSVPASSKNTEQAIEERFQRVGQFLQKIKYEKHIFLSSIGVYPDQDGVFAETYAGPLTPKLYMAEEILNDLPHTLIFRLGGLFGKERIFAKYFENKVCATGDQLANFVHVDDVVNLIKLGFERLPENNVYNIVSPEHPLKKEVIVASAHKYGYALPASFDPKDSFQKNVSVEKVSKALDYIFKYPSPLNF